VCVKLLLASSAQSLIPSSARLTTIFYCVTTLGVKHSDSLCADLLITLI
jgi:hypothetical protein